MCTVGPSCDLQTVVHGQIHLSAVNKVLSHTFASTSRPKAVQGVVRVPKLPICQDSPDCAALS